MAKKLVEMRVITNGEVLKEGLRSTVKFTFRRSAKELSQTLGKTIPAKFNVSGHPREVSAPGEYPRRVAGNARDSIKVDYEFLKGGNEARVTIKTAGRFKRRIDWLSRDMHFKEQSDGRRYAMPVSWAARKHASAGRAARTFTPKLKRQLVNYKGRVGLALVSESRATKPSGDNRYGSHSDMASKAATRTSGVHYLLLKSYTRKARKGLKHAYEESGPIIRSHLGSPSVVQMMLNFFRRVMK